MNVDNVARRLEASEGRVSHLYLCTGGKVTVGVGHALAKVDDARSFRFEIDGRPATDAELRRDYTAVAGAEKNLPASAYAKLTKCRMSDAEIDRVRDYDIRAFWKALAMKLPKLSTYPESAQEALFDMAFNLGLGGLLKYKKLMAAVAAEDWETAATQCHRKGISTIRNEATECLFLHAMKQPTT